MALNISRLVSSSGHGTNADKRIQATTTCLGRRPPNRLAGSATGGGRYFLGETLLVQRAVRWSLSAIWQTLAEYAAQDSNL